MSLHAALVTPLYGRDGGIAAHVAESAAALRRAGHEVTVVCARSDAGQRPDVVVMPDLEASPQAGAAQLGVVLRERRPDVVQLHDFADPLLVRAARAIAPVVASAHAYPGCVHNNHYFSPGEECHRPHGPGCFAQIALHGCLHARNPLPVPGMYRRTKRRVEALRLADAIVCYSRAVLGHLHENELAAQVIPPFTSAERTAAATGAQSARSGVLFVGRVVPAKGLDVLLRAMALVDVPLTIAGDGWSRPAAERLAAELGIASRVRFTGWLSAEQLARVYREAQIVALPSLWPEPFGLVGLEAMAYARPVVASVTGGVRDWLEHGVTGLGVPPGDPAKLAEALGALVADRALGERMGRAGRSALERDFSERRHVEALGQVFGSVLSGVRAQA